ncbi:hypothetical protein [Nocardia sp. NPDC005366]|uniref:hypothetical protein n=1 Tax=Nocardia sp. NPDC005366 TaxID=3156878 RepID=UPI0033A9BAEB
MKWSEPDIAVVTAVLPSPLELLRAARGHSIDTRGGTVATGVARCALELADLEAAEPTECTASTRAALLGHIEASLVDHLPHISAPDRREIRLTILAVVRASVELHRKLRSDGAAGEDVRSLCRRTAILAEAYTSLITSAARRLPWIPPCGDCEL